MFIYGFGAKTYLIILNTLLNYMLFSICIITFDNPLKNIR